MFKHNSCLDGRSILADAWPTGSHKSASFVTLRHIHGVLSATSGSNYRVTGPIRARYRTFGDTFTSNLADVMGHTSLPSCVALGHILGEICATSGSHYRVTVPIWARQRTFSDTFTGHDGIDKGARNRRMRGPPGHTSLPSFVNYRTHARGDKCDFRLPL
ncbi:hypothetical protein DPMN_149640 [Dreissena polymorpha]|uniref:Uncharacterized protein n=1 Tax=Dreissena polymorpha TaxID=45954 RepID=A0A9D4FC01_DREPO|nr:hypothetical protein DPMN_149640 [Dreissena polymorpha]